MLRLLALLAATLALVALAACSGDEETAQPTETVAEEVAPEPEEVVAPPEESAPDEPAPSAETEPALAEDEEEAPVAVEEEPSEPVSGDAPTEGQALYLAAGCGGCHGFNAEGSEIGPALVGHTGEQVRRQVRAPLATMPSYSVSQLSDEDLAKIVAYVESLGPTETHVEPIDLPELVAMHHWMALSAIRSDNLADAIHHVEHVIEEVKGDHLLAMEEIAEQLRAAEEAELHDAEHAIEGMLAGTAEPELTLKQLHLGLASAAIENRNAEEAIHHTEHFVELATGDEKADGELVLAQLGTGDLHDAQHGIEALLGFTPHG